MPFVLSSDCIGDRECSTAEEAAQGLTAALEKHKIMSVGQAAAGIVVSGYSPGSLFQLTYVNLPVDG